MTMTSHAPVKIGMPFLWSIIIMLVFPVIVNARRSWLTLDIPALDTIRRYSDDDPLHVPSSTLLMEDTSLFMSYDGAAVFGKESKSIDNNENETSYENVVLNDYAAVAAVNSSIPTNHLYSTSSPSLFATTTTNEEDEETIFICPPNQILHHIHLLDTVGNGWGSTKLELVETSSSSALYDSSEEEEGSGVIIFVGSLDASNRNVTEYDTYNNERLRSEYDAATTHGHGNLERSSTTGTILTTTGDKLEYKLISSSAQAFAAGTPTIDHDEQTNHAKRFADMSVHVVGTTNSPTTPTINFPTMTPTEEISFAIDEVEDENESNINGQFSTTPRYICLKPNACYTARVVSEGSSLDAVRWEVTLVQSPDGDAEGNTILAQFDGASSRASECNFGLTDSCDTTCIVSELYPTDAPSELKPKQRPTSFDLRKKKKSYSPAETVNQAEADSASASVNQYVRIRNIIVANSPVSKMALSDKNSIQSRALSWLYASDRNDTSDHQLVQRWALASFYYATNGNAWLDNEGWMTTDDECTWFGITCIDGIVHKLELVQNHLTGLMIPEIATLSNLYVLSLGNDSNAQEEEKNVFIMPLPSFLGDVTSLTFLNLAGVGLTSTIPDELFSDWSRMKALFLSDNDITGYIPSSIEHLSSIEVLWLGGNNIGGSIPSEIGQLHSLKDLSLESNFREDVTGKRGLITTIPSEIGRLTNLESLNLADNALSGLVPMNLGGLVSLRRLQLKGNYFEGQLPPSLGRLELLEELDISFNWLSSTIPPEYGDMISLTVLSLASNYNDDDGYFTQGIMGTIPTELGMLSNLQLIDLSNNYITGTLVAEIGNLQHLQSLFIQNNFLHGSIPIEYSNCASMRELVLQDNDLNNTLGMPDEICRLPEMTLARVDCDIACDCCLGSC